MNLSIAICPSTPLLVPELGGEAAAETGELRAASVTVARSLPAQWIAIGVGDGQYHADMSGTFAGYGADVRVSLSDRMGKPAQLPLPVLIAGWLRSARKPTKPRYGLSVLLRMRWPSAGRCVVRSRGDRCRPAC